MRDSRVHVAVALPDGARLADALEGRRPRKEALSKSPVSDPATAKSHVCRVAGTQELYVVKRIGRTDTTHPARARAFHKNTPRK
jgi:hypothetical protein